MPWQAPHTEAFCSPAAGSPGLVGPKSVTAVLAVGGAGERVGFGDVVAVGRGATPPCVAGCGAIGGSAAESAEPCAAGWPWAGGVSVGWRWVGGGCALGLSAVEGAAGDAALPPCAAA